MISDADGAARRAALSVSDGRSRVPGGGPWSFCVGETMFPPRAPSSASRTGARGAWPPGRQSQPPAADGQLHGFARVTGFQTMRATMATVATSIDASSVSATGSRRRRASSGDGVSRSAASCSASSRVRRSSLPGNGAGDAEPHDQHVRPPEASPSRTGRASSSASQTPAPSVSSEPDADEGHERADSAQQEALSDGRSLPDREQPQRGHGDAAADEQEHAREVQEEGPVACHPPSNVAAAKRQMPRWKPVA